MKPYILPVILFLFFNIPISSQAPDTLWTKVYGGNNAEYAYSIQQTSDDGFIIVGRTSSFGAGNVDAWLLKTDSMGDTLWTKTFGGNRDDCGRSVQQSLDGGYIITGWTGTFGLGYYDAWLIKTDPFGDSLWAKLFGGNGSDYGYYVQKTLVNPGDDGYIIGGVTGSSGAGLNDAWLIKTDILGNTNWIKTYGGSSIEELHCVEQTYDGGYISTGWTSSYSPSFEDVYLIRTNASGDSMWTKTYGRDQSDVGLSVKQTKDQGYIIVGWTRSFSVSHNDVYLIKTNTDGDTIWTRTYGGVYNEEGHSVLQTSDGGYIIVGFIQTEPANIDVWLIRTDSFGDTLWTKTIGGSGEDRGTSIQQTNDNGYIIAGWTSSFGPGYMNIWIIKIALEATDVSQNDQNPIPGDFVLDQNYPNPFNPSTTIKYSIPYQSKLILKIYDVLGNEIETLVNEEKPAGTYEVEFNSHSGLSPWGEIRNLPSSRQGLTSGVYFYQLRVGDFVQTKKMLLLK